VELTELFNKTFGSGIDRFGGRRQGQEISRVVSLISEEGSELGRRVLGVVVHEFSIGEEVAPVILLVVTIDSQVLLQGLVRPFCLPVGLGIISHRLIPVDVTKFEEAPCESRGELLTTVR